MMGIRRSMAPAADIRKAAAGVFGGVAVGVVVSERRLADPADPLHGRYGPDLAEGKRVCSLRSSSVRPTKLGL